MNEVGAQRSVTTADGRTLSTIAVGDLDGALVLHQHGGPSSRLEARLFDAPARALGLCVVGIDRPGIGHSSARSPRTFAGWAADLLCVADAYEYEHFAVTGWSEGGPWALAAAAYLSPDRLRHVTTIAGGSYGAFGANWARQYLSRADALGGWLALHMPPGFELMYSALGFDATHLRASYAKTLEHSVNDDDREVLARPGVEDAFLDASADCFAQGSEGLVADARVLYEAWDFDVTRIERTVHFWQGSEDRLVPPGINAEVARRMPAAVWHEVTGAGHFVAVREAEAILAIAATDLADAAPQPI